ncbi:cell wall-active antibiotics response protein [Micromonospora sp. HNM0581]|nr:cell wall-active antibiotics response protein [Micromonospora sp. HNM0581]
MTPVGSEEPPQDQPVWSLAARLLVAAALLVLGLGAVAVVAILSDPHRLGLVFSGTTDPVVAATAGPDEASGLGGAARAARETPQEVRAAPLDGRREASFELVDGLDRIDLRVVELGEELYRVVSPAASGARGRPELVGDRVSLRMERIGEQPGTVEVLLNARVTWNLRLTGGAAERWVDLSAARLSGLELVGGATVTDLRLPRVDGLLVVRVTGGVNQLDVTVTDGLPVRVRTGSGAGSVDVYGERRDGPAPGTVFGSSGWDRVAERIFLDLVAGANVVTVRDA